MRTSPLSILFDPTNTGKYHLEAKFRLFWKTHRYDHHRLI